MKKLLGLFFEFFKISLFVVGGGYSILIVADEVCARRGWTEEGEIVAQLPVFQMVPGLIATHTAVYVGNKLAGGLGALVGVTAVALPAIIIFTCVSMGYDALPVGHPLLASVFVGLRSALTGIIAATIIRNWTKTMRDAFAYLIVVSGVLALLGGVPVVAVLAAAMLTGIASVFAAERRGRLSCCGFLLPFVLFLKYGLLCFGGGFVLVPLYLEDFVGPGAAFLQLTGEEFSNLMAISQMTPGPIGVNAATFFGFRLAGIPGALWASAGLLLPGSVLAFLTIRSLERFKTSRLVRGLMRGIRPASVALMLVALKAFAGLCLFKSTGAFCPTAAILVIIVIMMMLKRKLGVMALIFLSAAAALVVRADDEVTTRRFPDADTVTLNDIERVVYHPEGTYETTEEIWTKLLTERGRRTESSFSLGYSKRYGEAEILFVKAIGTNGVERTIDVAATTKESTDNSSMSANIYDPLDRVITCTIPGLKVGETLHLKTRRTALKPRCEGKWADLSVMEWTRPILRATYEVKAPRELPLKRIAVRHPLGNLTTSVATNADGSLVHTFAVTNSPQAFPEPEMPPLYTQVQNVRVSTAADWPEISRWYWDLCAPHLAKTNAAMVAKVRELVAQSNQSEQSNNPNNRTISQIFKFVSQEVRYMGLTMEDTSPGYAPHDVDITFDNRYGVCRDKAGLLVAMLRLAGFKAFPVLIQVGAKLDPEVPQPFFNHAIVAVENSASGYLLMDPTNENTKDLYPSYLGNCSYLVARPEGEELQTSPVEDSEHNALVVDSRSTLARDGSMFYESTLDFRGINDTLYRGSLAKRTPESRRAMFERLVKRLSPGAELMKLEIEPEEVRDTTKPLRVSLAARLPEMVIRGDTLDELAVPVFSRELGLVNWLLEGNTALETRRFALKLDTTVAVRERLQVKLNGEVGELLELPPNEEIVGGYGYARTFAVTNGMLTMERTLSVGAVEFSPAEYSRLREDMKRVEAVERKRLVFALDRLRDANVRYLLDSYETTLFSDTSWVTTNLEVQEVLTYKGKKNSAELKFDYHPSCGRIDLLEATVSNRDGRVYSVTPKEVNELDCGWAASAPRYPSGKIMVVNLPSVEIGSVISVKTVMTVTNAPAPFYADIYFDSIWPIDRMVRRVGDFKRELTKVKRVPIEPSQPDVRLWRDHQIITRGDWRAAAANLRQATDIPGFRHSGVSDLRTLKSIRDWMAMHVKVAGPSLYELPLNGQLTDPAVVLKERYATRLDYMRALCALLRGAGYDAEVVFAADNAKEPCELRTLDQVDKPNIRAYSLALCRVRVKEGGLLGFGGETKEYFIGTENEYTPIGATAYDGSDYFDPASGRFGIVRNVEDKYNEKNEEEAEFVVRENGAVDIAVNSRVFGAQVGAFRKKFKELLPEMRGRLHQSLLGEVAQAASATSELKTDTEGYPASMFFSCYVPDYALVGKDTISITLPPFEEILPNLTGLVRDTPVATGKTDPKDETVIIKFPEGYTEIEHCPETFVIHDELAQCGLIKHEVSSEVKDGVLTVKMVRSTQMMRYLVENALKADYFKALRRRSSSRANRTVVVRRKQEEQR